MEDLFQPETVNKVILRIDSLHPDSARLWGKMNAAQMMAHCAATIDMASGQPESASRLDRAIVWRFRSGRSSSNDKPFSQEWSD
jgi:hypothetical protein